MTTLYFVSKVTSDSQQGYILSKNTETDNANKFLIHARLTSSGYVLNVAYVDSHNNAATAADTNVLGDVVVYAVKFHNKTFKVFRNGTQTFSDTEPFYDTFDFYPAKPLVIGANSEGDNFHLEMKMQEIIIFNDDFTEEQISKVNTYLQHKYNI